MLTRHLEAPLKTIWTWLFRVAALVTWEAPIPRITVHSLSQQDWNEGILHSKKDQLAAMAAYLTFLDQPPARGGADDPR